MHHPCRINQKTADTQKCKYEKNTLNYEILKLTKFNRNEKARIKKIMPDNYDAPSLLIPVVIKLFDKGLTGVW